MEMKSLTIGGKTYDEFNPAAAEMDKKLDKTGGTVTGNINMPGHTLHTEQIELKTGNIDGVVMYSESTEANTVNKPILSLYGSSADQAVTIFNVETPTRPYEAANKKYVDSLYATPNNAPLTFTGAVKATYDGTENVTVNIPNGGCEVWEEIRTMEISEDIVKTMISTDNNGAPFSLKKIYIEIKVVPPTNTDITYNATVCCAFNGNDPWGLQKVNLGEFPKNGEPHAILMISGFDSYAGKIIPVFVKALDTQSTANVLTNGRGTYESRGAFSVGTLSDINVPALSPCHSIGIGSYRLSLFAGTTIKIYGVRA